MSTNKIADIYPLSPMQQGMLFHSLYTPESGNYFEQTTWVLRGKLNVEAFSQAWQQVINRHTVLRTAFVWEEVDEPLQIVYQQVDAPITELDWTSFPANEQENRLTAFLNADIQKGFELSLAPLIRLTLIHTSEQTHYFVLSHHHLLLDGWSLPIIYGEVFTLYEAHTKNKTIPLPPAQPYRNYIAWIQQQDKLAAENYWRQQLAGFNAPTPLIIDQKQADASGEYILEKARIPESVTTQLYTIAKQNQITLNTILQGVWALLLSRYSGEEDVLFGATISGRPADLPEVENLVGLFINTLPVRVKIESNMGADSWLKTLHEAQLEQRQFEYTALVDIQGWSEVPRDLPLFDSIFVFESYPLAETVHQIEQQGSIKIEEGSSFTRTNFPLTFAVSPGEQLGLIIGYDNGRFSPTSIARLLNHLQTLLAAIAANPQQPVGTLPMLTPAEKQLLLKTWNNTQVPYQQAQLVHQLVETQAKQQPEKVAVVGTDQQLTYQELNQRSNQLARYLQKQGVAPDTFVSICIPRSPELIVAALAVLKAGGAYVPLDPAHPINRLNFMLQDTNPPVVLTTNSSPNIKAAPYTLINLEQDWVQIASEDDTNLDILSKLSSPAYVIYTSGSTGQPKGVLIEHNALLNLINWHQRAFNISAADQATQLAGPGFDAAVWEIWPYLAIGSTLHIPDDTIRTQPALLRDWLLTHQITVTFLPTPLAEQIVTLQWPSESALRIMLTGGDQLHHYPAADLPFTLINNYGPTEDTVVSTSGLVPASCQKNTPPTIGQPIDNTKVYILDAQQRPVPIGVPGELYIGGVGLAVGYLNQSYLTQEKFVQVVVDESMPPERLFKTGDLVRYQENSEIEFLGRIDNQVSIRGFRIELGEIESVLGQHTDVKTAVVSAIETEAKEKQLVAYILPQNERSLEINELHAYLRQKMPLYMVPSQFIILDSLPITANGKIDRRALPTPAETDPTNDNYVAPRTPEEEILAGLWSQVLGIQRIGIHDDFFALGGHSLKATQLVSRIREVFQVDLPLRQLFEHSTIAGVSQLIQSSEEQSLPPITPATREADIPVSFSQQRLWFLEQLSPGNTFYNIPTAIRLTGSLDINALEQSIAEIIHRHESLRTLFLEKDGLPVQHILPTFTFALPLTDMRHLPEPEREHEVRRLVLAEAQRPFNLATGPLIRTQLYQLADDDFVALLTMHHIISDGWSMGVLVQELAVLYNAFATGEPSPLPDLPIQYADYAIWQRQWLQGDELASQLAYWKEQLGENPAMLNLPTDHPRPALQTANGAMETFTLPSELAQGAKALSHQHGVTLFMILLAIYQTLLARYTGQTDIFVGTAVANRNRAEIENLIGFFVNTLVMRTDLSGAPNFADLLERVREVALGAYAHQDLPFEMLVEALQPDRNLSHTPLFQVMFVLDNEPVGTLELGDLSLSPVLADRGTAAFDLTLTFTESQDELFGAIEYNTDLFEQATIQRMIGHYQTLLTAILADPDQPITHLPLLTPPEQQQMLVEWNKTAVSFPDNTCIHHLFEDWVQTQPDAPALTFQGQTLTYAQLNSRTNQLAHYLRQLGLQSNQLVGIATHRSLDMVVGILGTLKAGAAYVPLDPAYPSDRLAFMLQDAKTAVVLTQAPLLDLIPFNQVAKNGDDPPFHLLCLDRDWHLVENESTENPMPVALADNLAYVIYTSGSTGKPKGTMLRHRGLCNLSRAQRRAFHIQPHHSRVLQFSPLSFDASVWETFMALANGATLVLASQETLASGHDLVKLMQAERVTTVTLPPSVLTVLPSQELPRLETVIAAGEACPAELVARWRPGREFFNAYGPTETTVCASMYLCPADDPLPPPIGRPIDNFQLYVLDDNLQPLPIGVPGELHVGGVGLAQGYLHRPEMSAAKFIPNPIPAAPSRFLYKTGDLVRYRADGNIEFLGRIDHQVKVRGFRIELGEIEAILRQREDLQELVVVAREDNPGDKRLVAYIVPQELPGPSVSDLSRTLRHSLPEYMVPSLFVTLEKLPLSPSGKIERKALPAPNKARHQEQPYIAPRNDTERKLVAICMELLSVEKVGIHDSFFDLGGHSLLATQFISRVHDVFHQDLSVRALFETPTVAGIAHRLNQQKESNGKLNKIESLLTQISKLSNEEVQLLLKEKKGLVREEGKQ